MLRRPKRSKNEIVAPEEEDMLLVCNACFRGFRHSVSGWVDYGTQIRYRFGNGYFVPSSRVLMSGGTAWHQVDPASIYSRHMNECLTVKDILQHARTEKVDESEFQPHRDNQASGTEVLTDWNYPCVCKIDLNHFVRQTIFSSAPSTQDPKAKLFSKGNRLAPHRCKTKKCTVSWHIPIVLFNTNECHIQSTRHYIQYE